MAKIALVLPNINWNTRGKGIDWTIWPVSLCTFAAILEPEHQVEVIDANIENLSEDEFERRLRAVGADIVGISVFCDDFAEGGHAAARIAKAIDPAVVCMMGGSYVTLNHDLAQVDTNIEYFVRGEGEAVIKGLVDFISGKTAQPPFNGVIRRMPDGGLLDGGQGLPIEDLDSIPFPRYDKVDFYKYGTNEKHNSAYAPPLLPYGRITTSRGCPYRCTFCQVEAVNGAGIRYRSVQNTLDEIGVLIRDYGIKSILVDDANFTIHKKRTKEILRGWLERGYDLKWKIMNLAVTTLDEEILQLLQATGCNHIDCAVESGSQRVLKEIMNKPLNLEKARTVIAMAREMGFQISANFIIGSPGETWEEIRQTVKFAEDIDIDYVKIMVAMPLRHTKMYETANEMGYLRDDFDFFNMRWGLGEISTDEFSNIDTTILRVYEWDRINFGSPEKIERAAKLLCVTPEHIETMRANTRKALHQALQRWAAENKAA